jgi:hypothetical protein
MSKTKNRRNRKPPQTVQQPQLSVSSGGPPLAPSPLPPRPPIGGDLPPAKPAWHERYRVFIRLGETAIVLGLSAAAATAADVLIASGLLVGAWVVSALSLAAEPSWSRVRKSVFMSLAALCFVGLGGIVYYRHQEPISEALLASQIVEMNNLGAFLNGHIEITRGNNEENLRRLFDFPAMLSNNIWLARRNIIPTSVPADRSTAIDAYFVDSLVNIDVRYIGFTAASNGAIVVNMLPDKIGYVKVSKTYINNKNRLFEFQNSIQLPSNLRNMVADLYQTIESNISLMTEVMNEQYSSNANNLIGDQDGNSPYLGKTTNAYWNKFKPLKPKVDKIIETIRSYLKVG